MKKLISATGIIVLPAVASKELDDFDFDLRISTNAVKLYISRLRERAGDDWHKVKPELLATIEDITP